MKKIVPMLLVLCTLSCSQEGSLALTAELPPETQAEWLFNETAYFTMVVFDGERVTRTFVPRGRRKVGVNVHRGSLSIIIMEPPEGYAPLVAWHEPGNSRRLSFRHDGAALCNRLMKVAEVRPAIVGNLSLSAVCSKYGSLDGISPRLFISCLEKGSLDASSQVMMKKKDIVLENLIRGVWVSDRDDVSSVRVVKSGSSVGLRLWPGNYRWILRERGLMLKLFVGEDGSCVSSVGSAPEWS